MAMIDIASSQFEETVLREEWCVVAFKTSAGLENKFFSRSQVISPFFELEEDAVNWLYTNHKPKGPWLSVRKSKIVEQKITRRIYE